jgi:hypothetical protein
MQYHAAKHRLVLQMTAAPEFLLALIFPPVARKLIPRRRQAELTELS